MAKVGRNEPCPCGSEKEAKRCCFSPQKLADDGAARRILRQLGSSAARQLGNAAADDLESVDGDRLGQLYRDLVHLPELDLSL
ncbi:MAG: SEC-C metal-binding domain-containing protein, partial [Acidimicrobiales bacterium]